MLNYLNSQIRPNGKCHAQWDGQLHHQSRSFFVVPIFPHQLPYERFNYRRDMIEHEENLKSSK